MRYDNSSGEENANRQTNVHPYVHPCFEDHATNDLSVCKLWSKQSSEFCKYTHKALEWVGHDPHHVKTHLPSDTFNDRTAWP